jgi:hypothetical protein
MPNKKKKEEVTVESGFIPYMQEPKILKDTIEAERQRFFTITKRLGQSLSGLMITMGAVLFFLSLQYLVNPILNISGLPTLGDLLTTEFTIFLIGFLGIINIVCGFVLLAKKSSTLN